MKKRPPYLSGILWAEELVQAQGLKAAIQTYEDSCFDHLKTDFDKGCMDYFTHFEKGLQGD